VLTRSKIKMKFRFADRSVINRTLSGDGNVILNFGDEKVKSITFKLNGDTVEVTYERSVSDVP
jgi:hypothetical protein